MSSKKDLQDLLLKLRDDMAELTSLINETRTFKAGIGSKFIEKLHVLNVQSGTALSLIAEIFCEKCGAVPSWQLSTQFAGDFKFCDKCARERHDFKAEGDSFVWKKI